jgi:hypothetical protein
MQLVLILEPITPFHSSKSKEKMTAVSAILFMFALESCLCLTAGRLKESLK